MRLTAVQIYPPGTVFFARVQYLDIRLAFSSHDLLLPTRCSSMPVSIELLYQGDRDH